MAKTSGEIEKEFIAALKSSTGKDLSAWLKELKSAAPENRNDIVSWLKTEKKFGHSNAVLLTGIYLNNGKPVYGNEKELLDNQFLKCESMRSAYDSIESAVRRTFPDVQVIAKKTYVSFTAKREFAAINIKPKEIRLGMDLGEEDFKPPLEKSKLSGPMPRISHMVVITEAKQLDAAVIKWLRKSYERTNT